MATWDDVRRLALALPHTTERAATDGTPTWRVKDKLFAWERPLRRGDLDALGLTDQDGPVLAVRVPDEGAKQALVADAPDVCFTTPHFDGYASILVWLDRIEVPDLDELVTEAWLCRAPARAAREFTGK